MSRILNQYYLVNNSRRDAVIIGQNFELGIIAITVSFIVLKTSSVDF